MNRLALILTASMLFPFGNGIANNSNEKIINPFIQEAQDNVDNKENPTIEEDKQEQDKEDNLADKICPIELFIAQVEEKENRVEKNLKHMADNKTLKATQKSIKEAIKELEEYCQEYHKSVNLLKGENDILDCISKASELYSSTMSLKEAPNSFYGYYDVSKNRKYMVNTALSLEGMISYKWGSKPVSAGFNEAWKKKGEGLDCSGFIEWVYWTSTGKHDLDYSSTYSITKNLTQIKKDKLKPGDLGTIKDDGTYYLDSEGNKFYSEEEAKQSNRNIASKIRKAEFKKQLKYLKKHHTKVTKKQKEAIKRTITNKITVKEVKRVTNHVGVYIGRDQKGNDIWCHCAGKRGVVVETTNMFKYYWKTDI